MSGLRLFPLHGVPGVHPGDDLGALLLAALRASECGLAGGDILVVCQKVVSKAEGRVVRYTEVTPSPFAERIAAEANKDPRIVEVILRQTQRIVKMDRGHLIVETGRGWVCANAGVDESNGVDGESVVLLPEDPDASARALRERLLRETDCRIAVLVTDTFGRPWREGLVEVALGISGMSPLLDLRGETDLNGRELYHTVVAQADALAAAAGLLMRKGSGIPAVIVRGYAFTDDGAGGGALIRPPAADLFR